MEIALKLLRVLLLGISCYGYIQVLSKKIKTEFTIAVLFHGICCIMFFAGILNMLKESAWAILLLGVYLAILTLKDRTAIQNILRPGLLFFLICGIILFAYLKDRLFFEYDDFSHWGTALKVMINNRRFPNFIDGAVLFQSYPLGSAAFIFYFVYITGISSEWFQLFMQAMYIAGIMVSLFAYAKGWIGNFFAALFAAVLMQCISSLDNMSVDTLLAVTAFGAALFCYYYRDSLVEHRQYLGLYTVALVAIKNSGILFAIGIFAFGLFFVRKCKSTLVRWSVAGLYPLVTLFLWQKHVQLVYRSGLSSPHTMTGSKVLNSFLLKDGESLLSITRVFLQKVFSPENEFLYFLILIILLLCLSRKTSADTKQLSYLAGFSVLFYVVYQFFLFGMYLTTMPYNEAIRLASYARYHYTALVFCCSFLYLMIMHLVNSPSLPRMKHALAYLLSSVLIFSSLFPGLWYKSDKYRVPIRKDFQQLIEDADIKISRSYFIVVDSDFSSVYASYLSHIPRYLLNSGKTYVCDVKDYASLEKGWDGYDYLIVFGDSPALMDFLAAQGLTPEHPVIERDA